MFSNAFPHARTSEPIRLIEPISPAKVSSVRDVRRAIERWQTRAFIQSAMITLGAQSCYRLEEMVMEIEPKLVFPDDRPKLFDRMWSLGQPSITRLLLKLDGTRSSARWVNELLIRAPKTKEVIHEPIWRLLDPTPISYVELCELDVAFGDLIKAQGSEFRGLGNRNCLPSQILPLECLNSRQHLACELLYLRRSEIVPNVHIYCLCLYTLIRICLAPNLKPCLAFFGKDCAEYLAQCFGKIDIGNFDGPTSQEAAIFFAGITLSITESMPELELTGLKAVHDKWRVWREKNLASQGGST